MTFHSFVASLILMIACTCKISTVDIKPELKSNVLNFGYGGNFKCEGMLYHSFDRFYVVTKFEILKVEDLKLTTFAFGLVCEYLNSPKSYIHKYLKHCQKIALHVKFYQKQTEYYKKTAYGILEKVIGLILPTYNNKRNKRFIGTLLGSLASGEIGLAFEGISSFLHHTRHKALKSSKYHERKGRFAT